MNSTLHSSHHLVCFPAPLYPTSSHALWCSSSSLPEAPAWAGGAVEGGDVSPSPQNNTWVLETKRKEKGGTWVGNAEKVKRGALSKPPWDSPDTAQLWGDRAELGDTPYSHPGPLRRGQCPPCRFPALPLPPTVLPELRPQLKSLKHSTLLRSTYTCKPSFQPVPVPAVPVPAPWRGRAQAAPPLLPGK